MELNKLVRQNILNLAPYSTARDEYQGEIGVYLDANENPYDNGYNRYPDPYQKELKTVLSDIKEVAVENVFIGNGSDEAIDLVYRIFCEPRQDEAIIIKPSYGMYTVAARTNDVAYTEVALNEDYTLDADAILSKVRPNTKVIFLCSPNNPSGNLLKPAEVVRIIENFEGIVVLDEAYIDFCPGASFLPELSKYPNLIILQTLSKAWGMAGLRLGMAFASEEIIGYMTKVKYPYNINGLTQQVVINELLEKRAQKAQELEELISERAKILEELAKIAYIEAIYETDSNFVLVKTPHATELYNYLIENKIIVRDRSRIFGCSDTLRITIGTPQENQRLITALKSRV